MLVDEIVKKLYSLLMEIKKLINVGMRALTLVSKFALIFVLAKYMQPQDVGLYGLLAATIALALMALGFDFYTFSTRELIASPKERWASMLRDQCIFYILAYAILMPVCLLLFKLNFLPWFVAAWFFPLLAFEHVAQELNRLLVAISQPLWASVVLFVRSGLWAVVVSIVFWFVPEYQSLEFVFSAWLIGVMIACVLGFSQLKFINRNCLNVPVNWSWIKKGVVVAVPFILATLSLRALYTLDRYWIEYLAGLDQVAAYVLFVGIAGAILNFLDAAVFSFSYPSLIASVENKNVIQFERLMRKLAVQTVSFALLLSVAALLLATPVLEWIGKSVYLNAFDLLYVTVLAAVVYGVAMIPHYGLYALRQDRAIVLAHVLSLPVFFLSAYVFVPYFGIVAIPVGMSISFFCLFLIKQYALIKSWPAS